MKVKYDKITNQNSRWRLRRCHFPTHRAVCVLLFMLYPSTKTFELVFKVLRVIFYFPRERTLRWHPLAAIFKQSSMYMFTIINDIHPRIICSKSVASKCLEIDHLNRKYDLLTYLFDTVIHEQPMGGKKRCFSWNYFVYCQLAKQGR